MLQVKVISGILCGLFALMLILFLIQTYVPRRYHNYENDYDYTTERYTTYREPWHYPTIPEEDEKAGNDTESDEYWDRNDVLNIEDIEIDEREGDLQEAFSRYQVHTRAVTWLEAVDSCWREGGHLAVPDNEAEARILGRLLLAGRNNITNTQIKDAMHAGMYSSNCRWNTLEGKGLSYNKFMSPVSRICMDYRTICGAVIGNGLLLDLKCNTKLIYACDMNPEKQENSTTIADDEYTSIIRNRRHKLHLNPLPWPTALDACEQEGAILAACLTRNSSKILADAIFSHDDMTPDLRRDGIYFGYNKIKNMYSWVDTTGSYCEINWISGSPNPNDTSNCAAMLSTGHAIDVDCSQSKAFLCEKIEDTPEYVEVIGMGRYALHTIKKSWLDAVVQCHSENATLAVPDTKEEADVLMNILKNGLDDDNRNENRIFVGVHDFDEDKKWRTIDGKRVLKSDFYEWDIHGYYYTMGLFCVSLRNGKYMNDKCQIHSMYICEKPL